MSHVANPGARRVLVLGYGNPGRQDDGLGPAAAIAIGNLNLPGVTVCDNYQLAIEDAIDVAAHDVIWFVDAARYGAGPFEVEPVHAAAEMAFTSHLLKPEVLLAIAQGYYGCTPEAFLMGIRGYEFECIEQITPLAQANLTGALDVLTRRISETVGAPARE